MGIIDAHHHLWRYRPPGPPWMAEGMAGLRRDFLVEDLRATTAEVGVTRTIVVETERSKDRSNQPAHLWSCWLGTSHKFGDWVRVGARSLAPKSEGGTPSDSRRV